MRGNSHVRFLGEGVAVRPSPYPTTAGRKSYAEELKHGSSLVETPHSKSLSAAK
jgi:hypothetical protein